MAYEVTATRKRPQDFDSLVGQEFVVSTLENAIKENRIAHAYLFSGPRGVGKTSSARLLAKALNCEKGLSAHPCGVCESCREITAGNSVDVIEIDGASYNGVDAVRAIKEEVTFPPQASRYKIYIIDEVHMLSISAFNALLKTIEEPPEYVIFIFATTELQKVPQTIRSRCQQFHFQLISQENIVRCLKSAAEDLGIQADEDALYWISKEGAGSMRDSYTLFDQVAAFSEGHITLGKIREKLGIASGEAIASILRFSYQGDTKSAIEALDELFSSGASEGQLLKDFTDYVRCLLFYKAGIRRAELLSFPRQDMPEDIIEMYSKEMLETVLKALMDLYRDIRYSISPRFELELLISRLSSIRFLSSPLETVRKLEEIRNSIKEGRIEVRSQVVPVRMRQDEGSKKKSPEPVEDVQQDKEGSTEPVAEAPFQDEDAPAMDDGYDDGYEAKEPQADELIGNLAKALKADGRSIESMALSSKVVSSALENGRLSIQVESRMAYETLTRIRRLMEGELAKLTGKNYLLDVQIFHKEEEKLSKELEFLKQQFRNSEIYDIKEAVRHESKPVRTDETTRVDRGPDETDEGGDV